ncbi:hypothetical protein [Occallatibacter riparius]|uniref:Transglycosylase SLT domain-containing protein n=1 Tax=Occallatibacter riparius TaxID=1002689 RepID=A0A9J7BNH2_9BACT|nr:hypothetical protein [Occallatibacter riparius]UWZ84065.1 hypothetical protein MOP44_26345 [Occallatibacter riparius]
MILALAAASAMGQSSSEKQSPQPVPQTSQQVPAAPQQLAPTQQLAQPAEAVKQVIQQEAAETQQAQAAGQPVSLPGAQGQAIAVTHPAVPVPPGPVPPEEIKPAPPTPIAVKRVELGSEHTWDPQWDVFIEENLPAELMTPGMAKAVHPFCPRFGELSQPDKRAFWAYLFQALAGAEAGLRPTADVKHLDPTVAVRDPVSKRTVRQQGLLQLTYEDNQRYGCDFDWDNDKGLRAGDPGKTILEPERNLSCGIRIMKNQLVDLNRPLVTRKSYWGTLRPGTVSYKVFAKQMANVPMACGAKTAPRKRAVDKGVREAEMTKPVSSQGGEE